MGSEEREEGQTVPEGNEDSLPIEESTEDPPDQEAMIEAATSVEDASRNIRVMVSISTNALEAFVTIRTPPRTSLPREMVDEALDREGIVYGIDHSKIEQLVQQNGVRGHPVIVARGIAPGEGADGQVEYHFETQPRPKVIPSSDGRVDYREMGVIQQVKQGDTLAVRTPALRGDEGMSVTGVPIKGKIGKEAVLMRGSGTVFQDEEKLVLTAAISGCAKLHKNGEVEVAGEYIIDGDVDYGTGNIRFDGAVIIRGDVKAGFVIVTTKDIEIKGIVEDAQIHCGGNLLVRGGFVGSGKGVCRVVGETHIRFLENQTVFGNGDVYIAEEIIHGNVVSGGTVYVKFGKGAIIGGQVIARKAIEGKILGNIHYLRTRLQVARVPALDELLTAIDKVLDSRDLMREKLQSAINHYVQKKYTAPGLGKDEEQNLTYLYHVMGNFDKWLTVLSEKKDTLLTDRRKLDKEAYIKADNIVFPGVVLEFDNLVKSVDHEQQRVILRLVNGNLHFVRPTGYEGQFKPIDEEEETGKKRTDAKSGPQPTGRRR